MGLHFQYKIFSWLFLGAGLLVLLYFYWIYWKRNVKRNIGEARLVDQLVKYYSANKFIVKFILILVSFSLGVLAVMNPRKASASDRTQRKGIDIAIALDVSKSMLATDMAPNRLERAKQMITKLMEAMPDDRIGLVLFAGKAYMQMPLTADHGAAALFVSSASPGAVPQQGTVLTDALEMSSRVFNAKEGRFKTIVLISDGEDHNPGAVGKAAELAEQGIMINTIGIGSLEGSTIVDPSTGDLKKDETGNIVISKLNEAELKEIAARTNGTYLHLENSDDAVRSLKAQLSQIDRKAYADVSLMNFTSFYPWLALAMLLFLLVESLISENKRIQQESEKRLAA